MKVVALSVILAATLGVAGCHANPTKQASPGADAASSAPASSASGKSLEKSRDSLMGKDMDVQNQHWTADPAASSSAAAPAAAKPTAPAPPSSAGKAGAH